MLISVIFPWLSHGRTDMYKIFESFWFYFLSFAGQKFVETQKLHLNCFFTALFHSGVNAGIGMSKVGQLLTREISQVHR